MNLTAAMTQACKELNRLKSFNGLFVIEAHTQSEEGKREDAALDGLTPAETEAYVKDYACVNFHLDCTIKVSFDSEYVNVEFDYVKLERDFTAWLLLFVGDDRSVFPRKIDFDGGDSEFQKPAG